MKNNIPAINTPERAAYDFLSAWEQKDYDAMFKLCQITWVQTTDNAQQWLIDTFSQMDLKRFEIRRSQSAHKNERDKAKVNNSENLVYVYVKVRIFIVGKLVNSEFPIVTIRESAPYTPDVNGTWGANPISALRAVSGTTIKAFNPDDIVELPEINVDNEAEKQPNE